MSVPREAATGADIALMFSHPDEMVLLTSQTLRLAKMHERQGDGTVHSTAYDDARHFRARVAGVPSLAVLTSYLARLSDDVHSAVVRAAVRADADRRHMRRLLHPEQGEPPTLLEVPRRWMALDFDKLDTPNAWWLDLRQAYEFVRPLLPVEFRRAACIVQATGSAGLKPGFRGRVWFLTERSHTGAELRRTLASVPGLDRSTTYAATLTYTARPAFIGMADPVPVRTALIHGEVERVAIRVPPEPPTPPSAPLRVPIDGTWGPKPAYSRAALDHACQRIVQAGEKEQHPTLFREATGIGALIGSGYMPTSLARDMLIAAGLAMTNYGRPWRREEVARQIDRGLAAGMDHPRVPGGA